ncbi:MAG: tetratricopeptide repeat protein [Planctomycetia bacterium]|nr:tetratricopeptide repeat protein [Planctomycetia bacterium]
MSELLPLFDRLLTLGRHFQQIHRPQEALHYLGRLAAFPQVPAALAEESQARLGEIQLGRKRYRRARKHLAIALLYRPESARYHYLLGSALAKGRHAEPERALEHYRKAVELDTEQPRWLAEFGLLCVQQGETDEGLGALMQAVQQAPNDPDVVGRLVKALCLAGRRAEAKDVLRAARFRNPRDGRFRLLWQVFMFKQLHRKQTGERRAQQRSWMSDEGPALLPFRLPTTEPQSEGPLRREDEPEALPGPHLHRPQRRPDWKHG